MDKINLLFNESLHVSLGLVTLIAAIIGVMSKTTVENVPWPKNVTIAGWILIGVSSLGFLISASLFIEKSKSENAVKLSAILEIEKALVRLVEPFYLYTDDLYPEKRFFLARDISSYSSFDFLCDIDIHAYVTSQNSVYMYNVPRMRWAEYLSDEASAFKREMGQLTASYGSFLDVDVILAASSVTAHPWLDLMQHAARRAEYHRQSGRTPGTTTLCTDNPKNRARYSKIQENYLKKLVILEKLLEAKHNEVTELLNTSSCPPFKMRAMGGVLSTKCIDE